MRTTLTSPSTVMTGIASIGENSSASVGVITRLRPKPAKPLMNEATTATAAAAASSGVSRAASDMAPL